MKKRLELSLLGYRLVLDLEFYQQDRSVPKAIIEHESIWRQPIENKSTYNPDIYKNMPGRVCEPQPDYSKS